MTNEEMLGEIRKIAETQKLAQDARAQHPCLSCGHCPTCGRRSYWTYPYAVPYSPPFLPWRGNVWCSMPPIAIANGATAETQVTIRMDATAAAQQMQAGAYEAFKDWRHTQ